MLCPGQRKREAPMLPIVDYGSIAIVVPKITAVGNVVESEGHHGFEVFLEGRHDPIVVGFQSRDEAVEARDELVAIIAQYHYTSEMGPDFDLEELMEIMGEEDGDMEVDIDDDDEKQEH